MQAGWASNIQAQDYKYLDFIKTNKVQGQDMWYLVK